MFEGTYTITSKPEASAIELVKYLRTIMWRGDVMTTGDILQVARSLQQTSLTVETGMVRCDLETNELVTVVATARENPYTAAYRRMAEGYELLKRGAAGDVEAALLYCKMELAGEIIHGPIG